MTQIRRTAPLALYAAATALLEPLVPSLLRRRAARGKEAAGRLGERLGRSAIPRPGGPLVWLHAVSVGESLSLLPLIEALRARRPEFALLVTSATVTSAELLAARLPAGAIHQFAPVDTPAAVARFLDHWRPHTGLFVESELWPNLIGAAAARGVKLGLVSARMTEASARGWARAPASAAALLNAFDLVLPQDAATAPRLQSLGATIGPSLNLKLTGGVLPVDLQELAPLQAALAGRRVVLAASTHPGEEALIARALVAAGVAPPPLLIVVPRHPARGPAVAEEFAALGFAVARRAAGEPLRPETTAYLADTLGELGLFLRLADVVVMGGAFAPGVGGHNPLEAARLGKPSITGPDVFNAAQVYADMVREVAILQAADEAQLARHLGGLLANPMIARRIGEAARAHADRQGQALDAALVRLRPLLPA